MKKYIAIVLASSFLATAAFAEDSSTRSTYPQDSTMQQPGTQPGMVEENQDKTVESTTTETTQKKRAASEKAWKDAKTCTDRSGVVFKKGKDGFERCMDEKKQQMGGEVGEMPTNVDPE